MATFTLLKLNKADLSVMLVTCVFHLTVNVVFGYDYVQVNVQSFQQYNNILVM